MEGKIQQLPDGLSLLDLRNQRFRPNHSCSAEPPLPLTQSEASPQTLRFSRLASRIQVGTFLTIATQEGLPPFGWNVPS